MSADIEHLPVLVDEVISYLRPENKKVYFDGTFGQGGYSKQILSLILKLSRLIEISYQKNMQKI